MFLPKINEILTIVGREMCAHSGSIMLVNEETGELEMVATFGLPGDYIKKVYFDASDASLATRMNIACL